MLEGERKIPCVYMRGGTSKACMFHDRDLPEDPQLREKVILDIYGSPDPRQIDGMGGATIVTSKVAVVKKSSRPDADVDYDFGQVGIETAGIGRSMNCGNISAAVGPFAVDEGLVEAREPVTKVRIYNVNTDKVLIAYVPVVNGRSATEGDYQIDGVPGTGAKIRLEFTDPQGAATGHLLPTGRALDHLEVEGRVYEYSLVDAANPVVYMRAEQFGLRGVELPEEFEKHLRHKEICRILEVIRGTCAVEMGIAEDLKDAEQNCQVIPKIALVAPPYFYTTSGGKDVLADQIDFLARFVSIGKKMNQAYPVTGGVGAVVAANTPGTVIWKLFEETREGRLERAERITIGHPSGIMEVEASFKTLSDGSKQVSGGIISRTARRLMKGWVYTRVWQQTD